MARRFLPCYLVALASLPSVPSAKAEAEAEVSRRRHGGVAEGPEPALHLRSLQEPTAQFSSSGIGYSI